MTAANAGKLERTTVVRVLEYGCFSLLHKSTIPSPRSLSVGEGSVRLCRRRVLRVGLTLVFGGHGEEQDGLLARSSLAPRLVLASPRQSHEHGGVLPGAVGVVVVALETL